MHDSEVAYVPDQSASCVYAVVVTYFPDIAHLELQLRRLAEQTHRTVIVDNGSNLCVDKFLLESGLSDQVDVILQAENYGLAQAQNVGIEFARAAGASHVVIFDQDSLPDEGMISRLLFALESLEAEGVRVAAVAPAYKDEATSALSGFVRNSCFGYRRVTPLPGRSVAEADFLISSGSLIPVSVLADVGLMDAALFIDHIDTEWCFRARYMGYRLFGVDGAVMLHSLGDRRVRFWFLRWRMVPYHSPFRYYYIYRNSFALFRRNYMPLSWKFSDFSRNIRAFCFFALFSAQRKDVVRMMIRGVSDGLRLRLGKLGSPEVPPRQQ